MRKISIFLSVVLTFILSACSQLSNHTAPVTDATQAVKTTITEDATLKTLREKAQTLPSFTYETSKQTAVAYFEQQQITFIEVKSQNKLTNIYLQNGKIIAVLDNQHFYDLRKGNLSNEQLTAAKSAEKWVQTLNYNAADRNIATVRTGDEAKLNYLCIAKLQQVANTKKVLRTSGNQAKSNTRLMASMRLNGKQFYQMDCVLSGDRVAKLSLIEK